MRHILPLILVVGWAGVAPAANWSFWRGPEQNGYSRETGLPAKVTPLWTAPYGSITTPIVQDGQVYIISKVGSGPTQQERVLAFDADTGKLAWEYRFNVWHTDIVEDRLGFTNMVGDPETGYVYAHGTQGLLFCFDKKGKVIWERSLTEEFGRVSGYGGRVTSPIIDEDKLILSMVNQGWGEHTVGNTRFVAFDKKTGQVIWWGSGNRQVKDTYYSIPVVAVIGGERLVLGGGGDGCIHAFKVRTGEKVWTYKLEDGGGAINCSPVVHGNKVWIGHGEENEGNGTQGRIVCLDGASVTKGAPKLVWQRDGIKVKFASPILHEGRLYVCDDTANLYCLDADSGKDIWDFNYGRNTKGSPVLGDGKIYVSEVDSQFHILEPGKDDCKRLDKMRFRSKGIAPVELHGSPAVADGRVYFTTTTALVCIGTKNTKSRAKADKIPSGPKEAPVEKGAKPTFLQVVPGDITLKPGESIELQAFAYDEHGRKLGAVKVDWSLAGPLPPVFPPGVPAPKPQPGATPPPPIGGELSEKSGTATRFTAAKVPNGAFGRVVAKVGDLTGYTRVRVAPVVPIVQDFEKVPEGRTPGGWTGTQGKFSVIALPGGNKVLSKRNDNPSPLLARANAYIGLPSAHDYSIEADVMGTKVRSDMPDAGVGANRYTLLLIGNDQELRLVTWDAQKRLEKNVPYPWKPNVWYRLKLTTEIKDGKGVIKGKVWPRDEKEPEGWMVQFEDPIANTEGAPVLYGFSTGIIDAKNPGAAIYYDNVKVTPHKK